ncbi:unnamed protein product [Larinioides sclopetarius]|uniref:Uncharacterized protein n=1 Tax=Larinioides sclopetarius TaxID=280406 RepID=A0AAV1Z588_9ARAC
MVGRHTEPSLLGLDIHATRPQLQNDDRRCSPITPLAYDFLRLHEGLWERVQLQEGGIKMLISPQALQRASCDNIPDVAVIDIPEGEDLSDVEMEDDLWAQDVDDSSPSQYVDPDTDEPQPGPSKRAKLIKFFDFEYYSIS